MALRIDLPKQYATRAFEAAIASLRRSEGKYGINAAMKELIEKDIADYRKAIDTISEVK